LLLQPTKSLLRTLNSGGLVVIPVWAIVVARAGDGAKSRLAADLSIEQRQKLVLAMLEDVLDVCIRANLAGVLVVVDTPAAGSVVERCGAIALDDPGDGDMNSAVRLGIQAACQRSAMTALVLPGDVPLVTLNDLDVLEKAAGTARRAVIIGASHDGQGTNALLLRPPDVIAPTFGPPSLDRHVQAGHAAGALTVVRTDLGLADDIDTPADLAALRKKEPGPRTAAVIKTLL
jgi:2-phospho-L-lactate/phosphoenolpyruvate guanylyltransferase